VSISTKPAVLDRRLYQVELRNPEPSALLTPWFIKHLEFALLVVCAAVLTSQLFVPPLIGLADNGDFAKVLGRVGLRKSGEGNFQYFVSDYPHAASWNTQVWYSEIVPAWIAVRFHRLVRPGGNFNVRYLAGIHAAIFVVLYYFLLLLFRKFRPLPRMLLALLVLWIFTDVFYVAYLNSFYSDTMAWLGLLGMVVAALHIVGRSPGQRLWWSIYVVAAIGFVTSKPQHAIWAIFPGAFAAAGNWRVSRLRRILGGALCLALLMLSWLEFTTLPGPMKAMPLFDVVFLKLTRAPGTRAQVLRDLSLPDTYAAYAGTSAWTPGSPIFDGEWRTHFYSQARPHLFWFYLSHPRLTIGVIHDDLRLSAPYLRPPVLANYRREDGYPPGTLARHFCSWSDLRAALFRAWPEHILLWYTLVLAAAVVLIARGRSRVIRRLAALGLGLALMGIGEFCLASLTDAAQTDRHLFLFHALTDLTFCFAAAGVLEVCTTMTGAKLLSEMATSAGGRKEAITGPSA
jgi:hypothetical protein